MLTHLCPGCSLPDMDNCPRLGGIFPGNFCSSRSPKGWIQRKDYTQWYLCTFTPGKGDRHRMMAEVLGKITSRCLLDHVLFTVLISLSYLMGLFCLLLELGECSEFKKGPYPSSSSSPSPPPRNPHLAPFPPSHFFLVWFSLETGSHYQATAGLELDM